MQGGKEDTMRSFRTMLRRYQLGGIYLVKERGKVQAARYMGIGRPFAPLSHRLITRPAERYLHTKPEGIYEVPSFLRHLLRGL